MGRSSQRSRDALRALGPTTRARLFLVRLILLVAASTTALLPRSAIAQPAGDLAIDLSYAAPAACPSRDELVAELRRRVNPSWLTGVDERRFRVRVEQRRDGHFSGRLEVERHGHEARVREIQAETCRAVTTALAVFIAIALDPASAEPEPNEPSPAPSTAPDVRAPSEPAKPPATAPSEEPPAATTPFASSPGAVAPTATVAPAKPYWTWTSAVFATYTRAPDAWGARVDAQFARTFPGLRLAPALRVSWGFDDFTTSPARAGEASFRRETLRGAACVAIDASPTPLTLTPCLGLEVGSVDGLAPELPRGGHASTSWQAAAALLRVSWALLPWLSIEAEVGALAPLAKNTFRLTEPNRVAYRSPPVLFTAGAGLGVSAHFR